MSEATPHMPASAHVTQCDCSNAGFYVDPACTTALTEELAALRAQVAALKREVAEGFKVEVADVTGDTAMMAENGRLKAELEKVRAQLNANYLQRDALQISLNTLRAQHEQARAALRYAHDTIQGARMEGPGRRGWNILADFDHWRFGASFALAPPPAEGQP